MKEVTLLRKLLTCRCIEAGYQVFVASCCQRCGHLSEKHADCRRTDDSRHVINRPRALRGDKLIFRVDFHAWQTANSNPGTLRSFLALEPEDYVRNSALVRWPHYVEEDGWNGRAFAFRAV